MDNERHKAKRRRASVARQERLKTDPAYRQSLREKERANYRASLVGRILIRARCRAKKRGLDFNLTAADIVIPDTCPVLGIPIFVKTGLGPAGNSPSIDRVDNTKGDGTAEEMRAVARYMEEQARG